MTEIYLKREIDEAYRIRLISTRADELVMFQERALRFQALAAGENLRELRALGHGQEQTIEALASIADGVDALERELREQTGELKEQTSELREHTTLLRLGFETIAEQLLEQHRALLDIAQLLRRPYTTKAAELRDEARKWLEVGMRRADAERAEDFADALRLYREVLKNPIGNQDYVAWFDIGWLSWQHEKDIVEAEKAFRRAARLSEPDKNLFHVLSVRHVAHMQYLDGRHEDAWQTIQKVLPSVSDHDSPFDAARYAARTSRLNEATELLSDCIDAVPRVFTTMLADSDFQSMRDRLSDLAVKKQTAAQFAAQSRLDEASKLAFEMERYRHTENANFREKTAEHLLNGKNLLSRGGFYAWRQAERAAILAIESSKEAIRIGAPALERDAERTLAVYKQDLATALAWYFGYLLPVAVGIGLIVPELAAGGKVGELGAFFLPVFNWIMLAIALFAQHSNLHASVGAVFLVCVTIIPAAILLIGMIAAYRLPLKGGKSGVGELFGHVGSRFFEFLENLGKE